jgi:protein transport protein SEC61 subunit gamma and related proteins
MVNVIYSIKTTFKEYGRVLRVTKKPGKEEFMIVAKVSALGALIIGFLGFVINMLFIFIR